LSRTLRFGSPSTPYDEVTPPRRALTLQEIDIALESVLREAGKPVSAEEVHRALAGLGVSVETVYDRLSVGGFALGRVMWTVKRLALPREETE